MFLDKQGVDDKALTVVSQSAICSICSIYVSFVFGGIAPKENEGVLSAAYALTWSVPAVLVANIGI